MNVEAIFPTLIGYRENAFSDEENKKILNDCYDIEKKIESDNGGWLSSEKSPYTTFRSHDLLTNKNFKNFVSKINDYVHEYAKLCGDKNEYDCTSAWLNIYKNSNYQEPHFHAHSMYSAVYFVAAPEGSGNIVFINPITHALTNESASETPYWMHKPVDRKLIIFKSSLIHYVLHNNSNKDRISIALNYSFPVEEYKKFFSVHNEH